MNAHHMHLVTEVFVRISEAAEIPVWMRDERRPPIFLQHPIDSAKRATLVASDGALQGRLKDGWIVFDQKDGCGLPIARFKELWLEFRVIVNTSSGQSLFEE